MKPENAEIILSMKRTTSNYNTTKSVDNNNNDHDHEDQTNITNNYNNPSSAGIIITLRNGMKSLILNSPSELWKVSYSLLFFSKPNSNHYTYRPFQTHTNILIHIYIYIYLMVVILFIYTFTYQKGILGKISRCMVLLFLLPIVYLIPIL